MKVSIAMATYNGARYLQDQLDSLVLQTRLPDEMIVCDDGSTDGTLTILDRFADSAPFAVTVVRNSERLGFANNFLKAGRLTSGHLVAWCDQDDVWLPDKLKRCINALTPWPRALMATHARTVGEAPDAEWVRGPERDQLIPPGRVPENFPIPGYSTIFRRRLLEIASLADPMLPGEFGDYGHDTLLSLLANAAGPVVFISDALAWHRLHDANAAGVDFGRSLTERAANLTDPTDWLSGRIARARFRSLLLQRLAEHLDPVGVEISIRHWQHEAESFAARLAVWESRPRTVRGALAIVRGIRSRAYRNMRSALARDIAHVAFGSRQ